MVDLTSVDEAVRQIQPARGNLVLPKVAISGVGYLATFGIMQLDRLAK